MANTEQAPWKRAQVIALHSVVLALLGVALTTLQLKQGNPFKTHYGTMVAFLVVICFYVVAGLASIKLHGFAEELTTKVSLLLGLLAFILLILIIIPVLGWLCLVLWALFAVIIAYKIIFKRRPPVQQNNQNQDQNHATLQMAQNGKGPG